ncbi:MAG: tRNA (guanosine(46)-N7)-methyltransferase TrmB [Planctomycetaceae bacterium]|jgi:tRNA (guanine-N7-)-methyltransferase|nr:tRNA (guanosine(46)-N7)-methyltransferase TrmB [Planctomycetaceae bacterium]
MPRCAVKTIDPSIDLSAVLKMPEELPVSDLLAWNSQVLFSRILPLELEIGSGKGLFINRASVQNPNHNFLGIEISKKYARLCAARLQSPPRSNAVMVCGDAFLVLKNHIPAGFLAAVHVYFPDPWWKRAHRKRRILRPEVLQLIENRLASGGSLHFRTDVEEYFLSTLDLLKQYTPLQGPFEIIEPETKNDSDYRTHFERRTRLHGKPVFIAEFRKISAINV